MGRRTRHLQDPRLSVEHALVYYSLSKVQHSGRQKDPEILLEGHRRCCMMSESVAGGSRDMSDRQKAKLAEVRGEEAHLRGGSESIVGLVATTGPSW